MNTYVFNILRGQSAKSTSNLAHLYMTDNVGGVKHTVTVLKVGAFYTVKLTSQLMLCQSRVT